MAFEYFVNNPGVAIIFTFIGVLVIGYAKFYERKTAPGSLEVWDNTKFGLFFVVAAAVMIFEYVYTGGFQFPSDEMINSLLILLTPIFGIFGTAYTTIIAGRLVKNNVVVPVIASVKADAAAKAMSTAPIETNWLAISVTPTYKFGKSPLSIEFSIYATQPTTDHPGVVSVDIDFADGNKMLVPLKQGVAVVPHTYTFVKNDEYTGHTFYPIFKCNGSDGTTSLFNAGERKSVEIFVESL